MKMNWKIIGLLIFIPLIVVTSILVWNNRASDKLVSNFLSVIFLGLAGLLITSLVSLKEEKKRERFSALMFLERNPLSLANYKYPINKGRITPIIVTNNAIQTIQKENKTYINLDSILKENYWKVVDNLFQRYIFDLLITRYPTHWYSESMEIETPTRYSGTSRVIDNNIPSKQLQWEELRKIFPDNEFIKIGFYADSTVNNYNNRTIYLPPNTTLKSDTTLRGFNLVFDNSYVSLTLKVENRIPDNNMNEEIERAYRMDASNKDNFSFQPFIIDYEIVKKKFRIGHPDMPKYEYWVNDLIRFLEGNISTDEFWRVVKLNN